MYAAQRIKELEDENQSLRDRLGKAIEPPCKVEDEIFFIDEESHIQTAEVYKIVYASDGISIEWVQWGGYCDHNECWDDGEVSLSDFNKTWFTDPDKAKAEAESRLAELGGQNGRKAD